MRPTRFTVLTGVTLVFPMDYFSPNFAVAVYPVTGTMTVTYTLDDVQDSTITPVYFALPAPLNVGVAANTAGQFSLTTVRALKFSMAGGGSCVCTVVQPSGDSTG